MAFASFKKKNVFVDDFIDLKSKWGGKHSMRYIRTVSQEKQTEREMDLIGKQKHFYHFYPPESFSSRTELCLSQNYIH